MPSRAQQAEHSQGQASVLRSQWPPSLVLSMVLACRKLETHSYDKESLNRRSPARPWLPSDYADGRYSRCCIPVFFRSSNEYLEASAASLASSLNLLPLHPLCKTHFYTEVSAHTCERRRGPGDLWASKWSLSCAKTINLQGSFHSNYHWSPDLESASRRPWLATAQAEYELKLIILTHGLKTCVTLTQRGRQAVKF